MTVKVSVVIPTYNCGKGYQDALGSLRTQSMPQSEYEVLFVDDGSTDDTVRLLEADTASDPWIRILRAEHTGGPGRPRNMGIEQARGEFVFFMDDDDRMAPEALERMYDQAVATGADIVVPRMAGHNRPAPREATANALEHGHVTTHPVLWKSMTALKLFRRSLLMKHVLRFPEGKVQLEDHIFTLQAHFLARSATVVHDYTCYHWVRADTATPPPHQGTDVIDYVRSVGVILDIIEHHVPPGSLRDMMIARWHQVKLLNRLDERVLKQDPAVFRTAYDAIAGLVRERVPLSADEYLPVNLRVRSAVLRAGGPAAVMALARHEAGTALVSRIESLQWRDGRLAVGLTSDLVREDRTGSRSPVRFVREGERIRWDLPAGLLALPGVPAAADVTEAMPATALRPYVRHREEHTDLYIPADQRITTVPLGRNAAGLPLMALRVEGTALLDPAAADHGQSVNGLWDFNVLLDTCGWSRTRRIGDDRSPLADAQLRAAFLADGRLAAPYWTKFGNLSIRIAPATLGGLKGTARETDLAHAAEDTGGMLRVRLPLELAPLRQPVPLVVTLSESDDAEPLLVQGTVLPNGSPELAELQFAVSVGALGGGSRWAIQLEQPGRTSRPADLGVQLRRSAPGTWSLV